MHWGVISDDGLIELEFGGETTGALLIDGLEEAREKREAVPTVRLDDVELLSPVTENQQVICQARNYREHARETGADPRAQPFNVIFRKASSCLCGATHEVVRPHGVCLLDYEVELGLVVARDLEEPASFVGAGLPDAVGALVVHNDVSARDIQIPQSQYYKGKSFRTFGPTGPYLTWVDDELRDRWQELRLQMRVNGELRQDALCADMIFKPAETITELTRLQSLKAGDLIATGTPSGVAMQNPPEQQAVLAALEPAERWPRFVELQRASGRYLEPGDEVEASIRTEDGQIDLGVLRNRVGVEATS